MNPVGCVRKMRQKMCSKMCSFESMEHNAFMKHNQWSNTTTTSTHHPPHTLFVPPTHPFPTAFTLLTAAMAATTPLILKPGVYRRQHFFRTLSDTVREKVALDEMITSETEARGEEAVIVAGKVQDHENHMFFRTVCIPFDMDCRKEHNKALAKHITSISGGRLKLAAPTGDWSTRARVVTLCNVSMGGCIIEAEEGLERRPVFYADGEKEEPKTHKKGRAMDSILASLMLVVSEHISATKPLLPMTTIRGGQGVALPALIQDLITPTNVLLGYQQMHPALRVLCKSILTKSLFFLTCTLMALRTSMFGMADPCGISRNVKRKVKKSGGMKATGSQLRDILHESMGAVKTAIQEFSTTFPSTHAFRTACCHLQDWKTSSEVNAISVPFLKHDNVPARAVVALRDIPAGAEVVLANAPQLSSLDQSQGRKGCSCKACVNEGEFKAISRDEEQAMFAVFYAMGLWSFILGCETGRELLQERIHSFPLVISSIPKFNESPMVLVREPQTFFVWRGLTCMLTSKRALVWTREAEKDLVNKVLLITPVRCRMGFWVLSEDGASGEKKLIQQFCEDIVSVDKVLTVFRINIYMWLGSAAAWTRRRVAVELSLFLSLRKMQT